MVNNRIILLSQATDATAATDDVKPGRLTAIPTTTRRNANKHHFVAMEREREREVARARAGGHLFYFFIFTR